MFYPKRNLLNDNESKKKENNNKYISEVIDENRKEEIIAHIKEICYMNKDSLKKVSLSQVNRFFSLLDDRNFSFESDKIKKFVNKQLERAEATENKDLREAKIFYKLFNELNFKNSMENKVAYTYLRKYVKYVKGYDVISEKLK
nr:hypothetical protein [Fusobacterium gastrosuis]